MKKGWTIWSSAVVFIVGHHVREPHTFAQWVRKAPVGLLHPGEAACWLRSLAIPKATYWIGFARFSVGPQVIAQWLEPCHEGSLIACSQAFTDVLFGTLGGSQAQSILEKLPHVDGYGQHILRAFGDTMALASHLGLYMEVPMHSIRSRFAAAEASKNMSHHVSIRWDLTDIQKCTLSYPQ